MIALAADHVEALAWFENRQGTEVPWPEPLANGLFLANKAKGIHKPSGWSHALSIKIMSSGAYPDEELQQDTAGRWRFRYHQEERKSGGDPRTFATNLGLDRCRREGVPIGILRQVKPKPAPRYEVIGLGVVTHWEDGFFTIEGPARLSSTQAAPVGNKLEEAPPASTADARRRVLALIAARRGQAAFRSRLLEAYDGCCAISGCSIGPVLEAAHIVPYRGDHTNAVTNGLLLRADLHTLFDLDLLRIDASSLAVELDIELSNSEYQRFAGQKLRLPKIATQRPLPENFRRRAEALSEP